MVHSSMVHRGFIKGTSGDTVLLLVILSNFWKNYHQNSTEKPSAT